MRFDHPELKDVWFTVKAEPNMRDILLYDGAIDGRMADSLYPRLWAGVKWLVDEWHCDQLDLTIDAQELMEQAANMETISIIKWAALAVFSFRRSLEPEKN